MKHKKLWGIAALAGMLLLIIDASTSFEGAVDGLGLCINVVIPSLFPFFFLSTIVRLAFAGHSIPPLRFLGKKLGIPSGCECILISSFLGGYPVGALSVTEAWKDNTLSTDSAKRLLGFCNNAGPSFIFGMLSSKFSSPYCLWTLWLIHILSALLVGIITHPKNEYKLTILNSANKTNKFNLQSILKSSTQAIITVCGWVILFRVLISIINKRLLYNLPPNLQVIVSGTLELTNGCSMLLQIHSNTIRFVTCSTLLAFGGLCVCFQTSCIVGKLGIGKYLLGKLMQCIFSFILSWIFSMFLFPSEFNSLWPIAMLLAVAIVFLTVFLHRKIVNRCRNCARCDV